MVKEQSCQVQSREVFTLSKVRNNLRRSSVQPDEVRGQIAVRTEMYINILWNTLKGVFEVKKPDYVDLDYTLNTLLGEGRLALVDTDFGLLGLRCQMAGNNWYNQPTKVNIVVPKIEMRDLVIDKQCVLYHTPRVGNKAFFSYQPIIQAYAEALAAADSSIAVNMLNIKTPFIAEATTKAQAETIKKAYDDIIAGIPLVVGREQAGLGDNLGLQMFLPNPKQVFVVPDIQDAKRTIYNEFLSLISINTTPTEKKERLVVDEVNSNNVEIQANIEHFKVLLEEANDKAKTMFGEEFSITMKSFEPVKEVGDNYDANGGSDNMVSSK